MNKKVRIKKEFWNIKTNLIPSEKMKLLEGNEYNIKKELYGDIVILEDCKTDSGLYWTWSKNWIEEI